MMIDGQRSYAISSHERSLLVALLSDLVKAVADVEGIDQTSVGIFARTAREAKLISQKGRGRGAAHMTVRDAANLLIAVNGSRLAKGVSTSVRHFRKLKPTSTSGSYADWNDDIGLALKDAPSFGEALEALIQLSRKSEDGVSIMDLCLEPLSGNVKWSKQRNIQLPEQYIQIELS